MANAIALLQGGSCWEGACEQNYLLSLRALIAFSRERSAAGSNLLIKRLEIAEPVPSKARNLGGESAAPGLLRLRLATAFGASQ